MATKTKASPKRSTKTSTKRAAKAESPKKARVRKSTTTPHVPAKAHRKTASPWRYAHGCRCTGCREAWRKYQRTRKGLDPNVPRRATNRGRPVQYD